MIKTDNRRTCVCSRAVYLSARHVKGQTGLRPDAYFRDRLSAVHVILFIYQPFVVRVVVMLPFQALDLVHGKIKAGNCQFSRAGQSTLVTLQHPSAADYNVQACYYFAATP